MQANRRLWPRSDKSIVLDYLSAHQVFGVLPRSALLRVADIAVERSYPRRDAVIYSGDPVSHLILVWSGLVLMLSTDELGNQWPINTFGSGNVLGLNASVQNRAWAWNGIAIADTRALLVRRDTFVDLYQQHPEFVRHVGREQADQILRSQRIAARLSVSPVSCRVADFLLESAASMEGPHGGWLGIDRLMSQRELGLLLGTSRETVSRALAELSKLGLIVIDEERVLILRPEALRKLAAGRRAESCGE